jgi:UDP-N-acetylmuramate dehydrogenase
VRRVKSAVAFGYRKVEGVSGLVFLAAEWDLEPGDAAALRASRGATLRARAEKQPLEFPSAGSVFKRPPGGFASQLIDACGLKGLTVGRAQVSPKHAGFIVNLGGATARDVMELIGRVRETVLARTGVRLELEQVPLGF